MQVQLEEFANLLLSQTTPTEAWSATAAYFERFGFLGSVYGQRRLGVPPSEDDIRFSNALLGWKDEYLRHKDYERDPLFIYAPQLPNTFFTGAAFLPNHPYLQDEDIAVIRRAEAYGIVSGIALKMAGGENGVVRGWNLLSDLPKAEMEALHEESGSLLHICAALADQRIAAIDAADLPQLTKREQECLRLLADGLRTEQIADRLAIRPVTVDLHMRKARDRLGARTREQALAIAISSGILAV